MTTSSTSNRHTLRRRLYAMLEPRQHGGLTLLNKALSLSIVLSVLSAVLESEPTLSDAHEQVFAWLEEGFGIIFTTEYLVRLWTSAEDPRYGESLRGKLQFIASPAAVLDLLAITPFFVVAIGSEAYVLRLFRLLRVLRLARLGRFSTALTHLIQAVTSRRYELAMSALVALVLMLVSSTVLYIVEGEVQPDAFGSIPRAMWWSIVTLTTVGYGDVHPVTVLGKIFAGATALTGIGLIAMPTGILAAAFSDALERQRALAGRQAVAHVHEAPDDGPVQ